MKHFLLGLALFSSAVLAANAPLTIDQVKANIVAAYPTIKIDSIKPAKISGMYEVIVGTDVFYASTDGHYMFQGDAVDLSTKPKPVNITEETRKALRFAKLKTISGNDEIAFNAPNQKYIVHVFTDIDCGYCRMLHSQVKTYNNLGISIRYLAFPRAGIGSDTFKKMQSVWCADNPQDALTKAKNGEEIPYKNCGSIMVKDPVTKDYELGLAMGVNGTPSMMLEDGTMLGGFVEPAKLKELLDQRG